MFLIDFFDQLISKLFHLTNNLGFSIILSSILINVCLLPFYWVSDFFNELEEKRKIRITPDLIKIKKIKNKKENFFYKKEIYKKYNYKYYYSLTGLLGLLIQVPFFLAAYFVLFENPVFKDVPFYLIENLSNPDHLIEIGSSKINLLPLIMTIFSLLSTYQVVKNKDFSDKVQLILISFFFLIFFYNFPSSILLYWTTNNFFSIFKNWILSKYKLNYFRSFLINIFSKKNLLFSFFFTEIKKSFSLLILPYLFIKFYIVSNVINLLLLFLLLFFFENLLKKITNLYAYIFVPLMLCFFYTINFSDIIILLFQTNQWKTIYSLVIIFIIGILIVSLKKTQLNFLIYSVSFFLFSFSLYNGPNERKVFSEKTNMITKKNNKTTILIVLDEYASPNELVKYYGEDSNIFSKFLMNSGWTVKTNFLTEELSTSNSIHSLFNYNLTKDKKFQIEKKDEKFDNKIDLQHSKLILDLKKEDYSIKSFGLTSFNNFWNNDFIPLKDYDKINVFLYLNKFFSPLKFIDNNKFYYDLFDKSILSIIDSKYRIEEFKKSVFHNFNSDKIEKYDFVYFHFYMPHSPYKFKNEVFSKDLDGYFKFYQYVSLELLLDKIESFQNKGFQIIITGDHGLRGESGKVNPYNTFSAFYGFENPKVDKVQDIGKFLKNEIIPLN